MRYWCVLLILFLIVGCTDTPAETVPPVQTIVTTTTPALSEKSVTYQVGDKITYEGVEGIISYGTFENGKPTSSVLSLHDEKSLPVLYYVIDGNEEGLGTIEITMFYKFNADRTFSSEDSRTFVKQNGIMVDKCIRTVIKQNGMGYSARHYLDAVFYPEKLSAREKSEIYC